MSSSLSRYSRSTGDPPCSSSARRASARIYSLSSPILFVYRAIFNHKSVSPWGFFFPIVCIVCRHHYNESSVVQYCMRVTAHQKGYVKISITYIWKTACQTLSSLLPPRERLLHRYIHAG